MVLGSGVVKGIKGWRLLGNVRAAAKAWVARLRCELRGERLRSSDLVVKADGTTGFWTCYFQKFGNVWSSELDSMLREKSKWRAADPVFGVDHLVLPVNTKIHVLFIRRSEIRC